MSVLTRLKGTSRKGLRANAAGSAASQMKDRHSVSIEQTTIHDVGISILCVQEIHQADELNDHCSAQRGNILHAECFFRGRISAIRIAGRDFPEVRKKEQSLATIWVLDLKKTHQMLEPQSRYLLTG